MTSQNGGELNASELRTRIEDLKKRFASILLPDHAPYRSDGPPEAWIKSEASVLVLLDKRDEEWHVFLTLRAAELRNHGGEVSFPGGKREADDRDCVQTALREAHEETGLPVGAVEVVGVLRPMLSKFSVFIHPVLCILRRPFTPAPNSAEVERCFWLPIGQFLEERRHEVLHVGPFKMHKFHFDEEVVFGLTAYLCVLFSMLVHQRYPEFRLFREEDRKYRERGLSVGDAVRAEFEIYATVNNHAPFTSDEYEAARPRSNKL